MDTTLIIMAAGIGSRYGAGIKQLAKMGPNLFKIWQNSNAAFSVAYLFFIIYQKSKVWTITRLENLSGVYVECHPLFL